MRAHTEVTYFQLRHTLFKLKEKKCYKRVHAIWKGTGKNRVQCHLTPLPPTMITPLPRRFALSSSYLFHPIELCTCLRVRVRNQRRKRFQVKKMSLQPKSRLLFYFFQNLYVIDMHLRVSDIVFLLNFTRAHTLENRQWDRSIRYE